MRIFPRTAVGKWAVVLAVLWPVCTVIGGSLAGGFYAGVEAGDGLIDDIRLRPLLAVVMLGGMLAGVTSFGLSVVSFKKGERAVLSWIAVVLGALLLMLLMGEIIFRNH